MDKNLDTLGLIQKKLMTWYEAMVVNLPNLVLAIVICILFYIASKFVKRLVSNAVRRVTDSLALENLFGATAGLICFFTGLFIALSILHLDKMVTSILAGAGVIGLALGFAFQEIASNFISGIAIAFTKPYQVGDIVDAASYYGEVSKMTLRTTHVVTFDGLEVIIPNKKMFTEVFMNLTSTPKRRVDVAVGVTYSEDLDRVERIAIAAVEDIEFRTREDKVELFYKDFGESSINFDLRVWVVYPGVGNFLKTRHLIVKKVKKAFDENGITIPFPIRTLELGASERKLFSKAPQQED